MIRVVRVHSLMVALMPHVVLVSVCLWPVAVSGQQDVQDLIRSIHRSRPLQERMEATTALSYREDVAALQAVEALAAGCRDENAEIRRVSVVALGLLLHRHDRACHVAVVEATIDAEASVRTNAVGLVLLFGEKLPREPLPKLLKALEHKEARIRDAAVNVLAHVGRDDPRVAPALRRALKDPDVGVRINATAGLWHATHDLNELVPLWLNLLEPENVAGASSDAETRTQLGSIGAAYQLYRHGLESPSEMIAVLQRSLTDASPRIRAAAARSLGGMARNSVPAKRMIRKQGIAAAIRPLVDQGELVGRSAAAALAYIEAPVTLPAPAGVKPDMVFGEVNGIVAVEAERFVRQTKVELRAWSLNSTADVPPGEIDYDPPHLKGATAYLEVLPDTAEPTGDDFAMERASVPRQPGDTAVLRYSVEVKRPGRYYIWIRCYSEGKETTGVHLGVNGTWPATATFVTATHKDGWGWTNDSRPPSSSEPTRAYLEFGKPGRHEITISAIEDGNELDKWLLTRDPDFTPKDVVRKPAGPRVVTDEPARAVCARG